MEVYDNPINNAHAHYLFNMWFLHGTCFRGILSDGEIINYGNPNTHEMEKLWQSAEATKLGKPLVCDIRTAASQTQCVESLAASGEIQQFPNELIKCKTFPDGDRLTHVSNLPKTLMLAYDREVLPAEIGESLWTHKGRKIKIQESNGKRDIIMTQVAQLS